VSRPSTPIESRSTTSSRSRPSTVSAGPVPAGTNLVLMRGEIRRDPEFRVLPSGDEMFTCDLTVRVPDAPAESVPVAWLEPPTSAAKLTAGDDVVVVGRVHRRFFRAGGTTTSRTEVRAERIVRSRATARVRVAVEAALDGLEVT
jgi:single-strand DNA-binding protein